MRCDDDPVSPRRRRSLARSLCGVTALLVVLVAAALVDAVGPGAREASAAATATVTWDGAHFSAAPSLRVGQSVAFHNASARNLVVQGTTANWASYRVTVGGGSTSGAHTFTAPGNYGFTGAGGLAGTAHDSGTIVVRTAPTPSPTHSPRPSQTPAPTKSPRPSASARPTATPATTPVATSTPRAGRKRGHAGGPTLGPGRGRGGRGGHGGNGQPPVVALPSPTAHASVSPEPAVVSLAQPVPRRRLGLPGAVAAVVLAGLAGGVVRLARAEYGPLRARRNR